MPWPCLKSPGYSRQCLARGGLGLACAVSLCVCSSAGPRTHLPLPHYRGAGHKSRKSSLIVLSWLAIDRQQAINNTREVGGRQRCFHIQVSIYSRNREKSKVVQVFTFLLIDKAF